MSEEKRQPWIKYYPADWRGDPRLRMCGLAARGLWADLLTYMHEGEPYGHLTVDGVVPDLPRIAGLVGRPLPEVKKALAELEACNVFSRTLCGVMYSRRMVRDKAKADKDRANGKGGGNPNLVGQDNGGVNPQPNGGDKAQRPEARSQKLEDLRNSLGQSKRASRALSGAPDTADPETRKAVWRAKVIAYAKSRQTTEEHIEFLMVVAQDNEQSKALLNLWDQRMRQEKAA